MGHRRDRRKLKTPFIKIVVTDDAGRYVLPQLPTATYSVWVRGYGLADSDKVKGRPGDAALNLTAKVASSPAEAAKVYPGNYWLSLLQPPASEQFPGTGDAGNGIPPAMATQAHWIFNIKSGCNFCHQLGTQITRTLGHMDHLGFKTPEEAWIYRTQLGVRGSAMASTMAAVGRATPARECWPTGRTRIANGELPPVPPRPRPGAERNVVVTLWDWGVDSSFMHDEISTDKNDPTVNAYGTVYAVSAGHGRLTVHRPDRQRLVRADDPDARGRAPSAYALPAARDAVELLGHAALVGRREPRRSAQPDDGSQRPRVDDVEDPQRGAGVLPRRLEPQVREVLSAELQQPPGVVLRSGDGQVHADRHVLRDASPAVR